MSSPIVSIETNWHTTFDSAIQSFDHRQKSLCLHNLSSDLSRLICLSQIKDTTQDLYSLYQKPFPILLTLSLVYWFVDFSLRIMNHIMILITIIITILLLSLLL